MSPLKLKQDVITRWNSTHDMFKRILEIIDAVVSTLSILQCPVENLTATEWEIIEHSTEILQICSKVTREICSDQYVSMSKTLIFIRAMTDTIHSFKNNTALPDDVKQLVSTLLDELNSRFLGYEESEIVTQAALLDPRFKKIAFSGYHSRKLDLAIELLKRKVCQMHLPGVDNEITPANESAATPKSSLLWKNFDEEYKRTTSTLNPTAAGIIELDRYLNEPLINRYEDPLQWWAKHKLLYPCLFIMVKKLLCVPATSVPCERIFSKAGMVITEKRSRLLASKSSQVLFLNQNL